VWFVILPFFKIGPGLPPPEVLLNWYLSTGDMKEGCPPYFPSISHYCGYANHTLIGDSYLVEAWYFDNEKEFLQGEKELYHYLEEHGRVSTVKMNISRELKKNGKKYSSKSFNATKYENETTSGYFLVYKKPFSQDRDDYFIVYYGFTGAADPSNQTPFLKEQMVTRWLFWCLVFGGGTVGNLSTE